MKSLPYKISQLGKIDENALEILSEPEKVIEVTIKIKTNDGKIKNIPRMESNILL